MVVAVPVLFSSHILHKYTQNFKVLNIKNNFTVKDNNDGTFLYAR